MFVPVERNKPYGTTELHNQTERQIADLAQYTTGLSQRVRNVLKVYLRDIDEGVYRGKNDFQGKIR